ncbi:Flp pilus assembly complex ATPase component TadA [bacterium]|nr:Flp pilus assembly complex ATPase component TadA [bacterium]
MLPENVRVLVVDDDENIRLIVRTALETKGYSVADAEDAEQALISLSNNTFDLLISDIQMPGMSGVELLQRVKRQYPSIGIVLMTAFNESYDIKEALLDGAEEFIEKPFDVDELYNMIEKTYWRTKATAMKLSGEMNEKYFGSMLVSLDLVSEHDVQRALADRREHEKYLAHTLIRLKSCQESEVLPILAENLGVEYVSLKGYPIDQSAVDKVPAKLAYHYKVMPIDFNGAALRIATMDPLDVHVLDDMRLFLGVELQAVLASEEQIAESLKNRYGLGAETVEKMMDENIDEVDLEVEERAIDSAEEMAEDASVIKFVNQVFLEAYKDRATDIHIEPFENELRIRNRIDGILYETNVPPDLRRFHSSIVSRIKIMANLNIAERRLPQDGRIKIKMKETELDLRISTLPTSYGETVNIRLLTANNTLLNLEQLGYDERELAIFNNAISKPHGIILVTGPTGSGKSTTLYACLKILNNSQLKIITIEDPIEYRMHGISQIQVIPKIDLTFARALRSMLRHDPDVMMIGEIRDYETAEAAIRAALTGHLVFSTVHTNDAASSVTRLIDMGVEPYLVSSSVECVIAQRLVRKICESCKAPVELDAAQIRAFHNVPSFDPQSSILYEGTGCDACKFTGFRGRTVIYEIMVITDVLREMVVERVPANRIKDEAIRSQGMQTLKQTGLLKALRGITTVKEVLRVAQEEIIQ